MRSFYLLAALLCWCFYAQGQCGSITISIAQNEYNYGRLDTCITKLQYCLNRDALNSTEKVQAYKLLAECYLAMDSVDRADESIRSLLLQKNNFEADSRDPDRFRLAVLKIKSSLRVNSISSVSKRAESLQKAPATIMVITADDIVKRGYQNLEAVFSDLPGFDVSRTNGLSNATIYMRGYRSSALTDRILILIDGVEDNELWTNAAFISMQYPLSNVKRIEVIYGPASTIYGANAYSGVINVVTKDQDDFFPDKESALNAYNPSAIAVNLNTGIGSYHTRFIDGTLALKHNDLFFTLTARGYYANEPDLSAYPNWDGKVNTDLSLYKNRFRTATDSLLRRAQSLDKAFYQQMAQKGLSTYSNQVKDYYVSSRVQTGDFKLGFQLWNISEGSASDFVDANNAINGSYSHWQIKQYFINAAYDKNLSDRFSISVSSFFKSSQHGPGAVTTTYATYLNKLTLADLLASRLPSYTSVYYLSQNNQFRTEVTGNYLLNKFIDINGGIEFRNGILQGAYLKATDPAVFTTGLVADSLPGGNNYSSFTISTFAQINFQDVKRKINFNVGGRLDHNTFRGLQGYGSVFNPRAAVVYYPGKFIIKLIYAEAFEDASSFNRFSTSGSRLLSNLALQPEKIKNIEFNIHYNFTATNFIEIAGYRAFYSSILQSAVVLLPSGQVTTQFKNYGRAAISGVQFTAQAEVYKKLTLFANGSFTNPFLRTGNTNQDSLRIGDIASIAVNAGANLTLIANKLNVNVRTNWVGNKPTGSNTSVSTNPLNQIDGYAILNTSISIAISSKFKVQLQCSNIFNSSYLSPGVRAADNINYSASVPQSYRNYSLNLFINLNNLSHGR